MVLKITIRQLHTLFSFKSIIYCACMISGYKNKRIILVSENYFVIGHRYATDRRYLSKSVTAVYTLCLKGM